jgi:4-amino-4-deoxy-L-arabinose transferase-like glycosyltransferase
VAISTRQARALTVAAIVVPVVLFFLAPPLAASGLWDPHELNVAEFSRRIAVSLFGAGRLALDGADNHLPYLNDLGRPSLPFLSVALGFKFFGLSEWAGRLPLALWGVAGVAATYAWVSRLIDRRAGFYTALVLSTMPLYAVHARTLLGDICAMSAFTMAFGGLLVAVIDDRKDERSDRVIRLAFAALGVGGLVAGYYSRGALLGVAAPMLAVGAAVAVAVLSQPRVERLGALALSGAFVAVPVAARKGTRRIAIGSA